MPYCIQTACKRPIEPLWDFCPYCGQNNRSPHHQNAVLGCPHSFPIAGAFCSRCGASERVAAVPLLSPSSLGIRQPLSRVQAVAPSVLPVDAPALAPSPSSFWDRLFLPIPNNLLQVSVTVLFMLFIACTLLWNARPDTRNAQAARALVISTYEATRSGNLDDIHSVRWEWKALDDQYGRVRDYTVQSQRQGWNNSRYRFTVRVTRERTTTTEIVDVQAGPSKLYGYTSYIDRVGVE